MTKNARKTTHETTLTKDLTPCFRPSYGNEKTGGKTEGMMAVGYFPSAGILYYKDGTPVSDCLGTCGAVNCSECQKACYAVSMVKRYKDARKARIQNTLQLRENIEQHFSDMADTIRRDNIRIVRYTDSGEIESYEQFDRLSNLAAAMPNVRFYLYTKNYNVLRAYFDSGRELPANMVVLISIWEDLGEKEFFEFRDHKNIKAFAVKPATVKPQVMCPAYKVEGGRVKLNKDMTCAKCGLCTVARGDIQIIGCLEH